MHRVLFEFVPEGNVVLELYYANAPFAVWSGREGELKLHVPEDNAVDELDGEEYVMDGFDEVRDFLDTEYDTVEEYRDGQSGPVMETVFGFRVSGKVLREHSRFFRRVLPRSASEAATLGAPELTDGFTAVVSEWDLEALRTVLAAMHGVHAGMPRHMTLEQLAKVAEVVDALGCTESVSEYVDTWTAQLPVPPREYGRELVLWMFVACVFDIEDALNTTARVAIVNARDLVDTMGLRIPGSILSVVEASRVRMIMHFFDYLGGLMEYLEEEGDSCAHGCTLKMLDQLVVELRIWNLEPEPLPPYVGYNFRDLSLVLRQFNFLDFVMQRGPGPHCCDLHGMISPVVDYMHLRCERFQMRDKLWRTHHKTLELIMPCPSMDPCLI